jgi:putative ABC transport system ATP-binding protein
MAAEPLVVAHGVGHWFGSGALRKQILYDIDAEVAAGEIVILTGPSGSGKTTLLTLIGALRAAQEGSLSVLGQELRGASEGALVSVRRRIGYIFQLHNLLDALTATQNVTMGLRRDLGLSRREARARALEILEGVGLTERGSHYPDQLSAGEKQRVAVARALAGRPRIILADEPTASLDRASGREVVDRIHALAKSEGSAVILVTHDNRILDVADRIIHLDEGRLSGFADAVLASTQQLLGTLAKSNRTEELVREVDHMTPPQFARVVEQVTAEAQQLLQVMTLSTDEAFEIMLEQILAAFTLKVGQLAGADRASLLLTDEARGELWSKVAQPEGGRPVEIRIPIGSGIAGHVLRTGDVMNIADAYESPLFNREVDRATGYRTRNVLSVPIRDRAGRAFAVMTLLNKRGAEAFDERDAGTMRDFAASIGVLLETWHEASTTRRGRLGTGGGEQLIRQTPGPPQHPGDDRLAALTEEPR